MANEQTSVPLYAASEILTAANMNISAGTGVPVFATTVTRDAAFGGANEKVLAEGQLCYLSSTNVVQYYSGTTWASVASNVVVQQVNTQTGAVATGTTIMPFDDTIPQSGEGTQFMTLAVTPTSATNNLFIQVDAICSFNIANTLTAALFQDATASALAAASEFQTTPTGITTISFNHTMVAGTTSATTFKIRIGGESAGTLTFNGYSSARMLGGVFASSITITEITT